MNRLAFALFFVFAAVSAPQAANVTIKGQTISFTAPAGYTDVSGGPFQYVLDFLQEQGDKDFPVNYTYISDEDAAAGEEQDGWRGRFVVVMSHRNAVTNLEFFGYKWGVQELFDPEKASASSPTEKSLGFVNETATEISVLTVQKDAPEDATYRKMCLSTHMLRADRLILVHQYEDYTTPEHVQAFKTEALARLAAMNFPPPEEPLVSETTLTAVAATALLLVVVFLVYGFYRFRPKKK